jgi:hypothetical protein
MKYLKTIGLLVVATASLLAFAANAYATPLLTSPAGTEYTGTIHLTLKPGTSTRLEAGITNTCTTDTIHADITTNDTTVASGPITSWTFGSGATPCSHKLVVLSVGSFSVGTGGAVSISGNEWTTEELGISCVYGGGAGTNIGTLAGGTPAMLNVSTTALPKISGGIFCASKGTWTATYVVTTPATLLVDN